MKLHIPTANQVRNRQNTTIKVKQISIETIARIYINGKVAEAISNASENSTCVNVEVPSEAYRDLDGFTKICQTLLKPLGYTAEGSHDGAGMYNTVCVCWK